MKRRIKLTESSLHNMIKKCVRGILSEGALSPKDYENWQSWNEIDRTYPQHSDDDVSDEELEMYQSMGNPSQYATKGEFRKSVLNSDGYGRHDSPLRYDDGNLSIAAQSEPMTSRDVYGDDDDSEVGVRYRNSDGKNKLATKASYAKDPRNFRGNQDMRDLESDRIAQANADTAAEDDYMRKLAGLEESIRKTVKKHVKKILNEIGDTQRGQYALGRLATRQNQDGRLGGADTSAYARTQRNNSNDRYTMNASYQNGISSFHNQLNRKNGLNDNGVENKDGYYEQQHFGQR